jgi:hypothetical protein
MLNFRRASPGHVALLLGSALFLLGFQLLFFDRWISFMDEGHILALSDIIANGGELYRDATTYPLPGSYYLLALAFELFGSSNLVARWLVCVEFAVLGVCLVLILRRFVPPLLAPLGLLLAVIYRVWSFPHWQIYTYSASALCALAVALVLLLRFLETRSTRVLAGAGLAAGLGALCKQDYGAAGLLAMNLTLLLRAVGPRAAGGPRLVALLAWLNGPVLALGLFTAGYFAWHGLLLDMLRQTALNHLVGIASFKYSSLPPLLPLLAHDVGLRDPYGVGVYTPAIMFTADWTGVTQSAFFTDTPLYEIAVKSFFYAPYGILLFGALRLLLLRDALRDALRRPAFLSEFALYAFGALLLLSLNKPKDYVHMAVLYWPLLCLLVVYAAAFVRARPELLPLCIALALLVGGPALGYTGRLAWQLRTGHDAPLASERAGIRVTPSQAELIDALVAHIHERTGPDDPVAVFPYYPMVSFLAERRGPHPGSYLIWPAGEFENRDRVIIDALEQSGTDLVVYHFTQWNQFPRVDAYAPEHFAYLTETFEIDRVFSEEGWGYMFAALRRSGDAANGRPLIDESIAGTLRVEIPGEPPRELEDEARDEFASFELWPFRPVIALRPQAGGGRTALSIPLEVPERARLHTAIGVHPRFWFHYPSSSVSFTIRVLEEGGARSKLLYARTLDPHLRVPDRRWFDLELPLDDWAGRAIELEFAASCQREIGETFDMAGFGVPRLAVSEEKP